MLLRWVASRLHSHGLETETYRPASGKEVFLLVRGPMDVLECAATRTGHQQVRMKVEVDPGHGWWAAGLTMAGGREAVAEARNLSRPEAMAMLAAARRDLLALESPMLAAAAAAAAAEEEEEEEEEDRKSVV